MVDEKLRFMQKEIYKILEVFKEKCEENNLRYFLFYGTLLGAIRHDGFIPWDDDIDLAMPRPDYEKFISLFKEHFTDDYYLDGYNCNRYESFSPNFRINDSKLLLRKDKEHQEHYICAFISIWPVDGMVDNKFIQKLSVYRRRFRYGLLRAARSSRNGLDKGLNRSAKEKFFVGINRVFKLGKLLTPGKAAAHFNKLCMKYDYDKSPYCQVGYDPVMTLPKRVLEGTTSHLFE